MKNTFGNAVSMTIFGESHGPAVGAVLDGLAAGLPVDEAAIAAAMDRRRARGDGLSTARTEADAVEFLSGVYEGRTTGTAITLMIRNLNTRSGDYAKTADLLRPGHADYTAYAKYEGFQDARGGGHFSGRITAALVAGGALVLGALNRAGIEIVTHIGRCAGISDAPFALDDPAALAAQAEALLNKSEGFALLDVTAQVQSASTVTERVTLQQTICREGTAVLTDRQNLLLQPGESRTVSFRYCVDSPALWSPENPNLYTSTMQVLEGEEELDREETGFGIRTLSIDAAHGVRINGQTVKLRGACIHHDNGILGAATLPDAEERRIRQLKEAGFNAIRSSHHPAGRALLDFSASR